MGKRSWIAVLATIAWGLNVPPASAVPEGPTYPSAAWTQREAQNYARVLEAPAEEVSDPAFLARWSEQSVANTASYLARDVNDPSWLLVSSPVLTTLLTGVTSITQLADPLAGLIAQLQADPTSALQLPLNLPVLPLCATWALPCSGDPFRYPGVAGADGAPFYTQQAIVQPVVFYDRDCARLSGRVWEPRGVPAGTTLPAVVIENGSVQAPEPPYWWAAQLLVRNGYVVMTFDPRGQGRSDFEGPQGQQGSNLNPSVFWIGLVDAIDFFRSSPSHPYPNEAKCGQTYPTATAGYNPFYAAIDPDRLGIAGHSLGAEGVSIVQGYGAPGADPWPGQLDASNPVKVAVAWDGLLAPGGGSIGGAAGNLPGLSQLTGAATQGQLPNFGARVPSMGQSSEYGLTPTPFLSPPDPEGHKAAFDAWKAAGVPVFEFTIQGSSHYEWSLLPAFPASSWCPQIVDGACSGGWGNPMAQYYTLAWFDRWLKRPGEPGYATADARLLDDAGPQGAAKMSFYFRSARAFPDRGGVAHDCDDIRAGCSDASATDSVQTGSGALTTTASGGGAPGPALLALGMLAAVGRRLAMWRRSRHA